MGNKKITTRLLTILSAALTLASLGAPAALAAITCNSLNPKTIANQETGEASQDANDAYKEIKNMVITINEETIGEAKTEIGELTSIPCFRKTHCSLVEGKQTCNSWYVEPGACEPVTTDENTYTACQRVQVLYAPSGAGLLYGYISIIYRYAAGIIGIISVLYLVYGGIMVATAGDNTGRIDEAKQKIYQSIAGLILLFLSAVILYTINPNFFTL